MTITNKINLLIVVSILSVVLVGVFVVFPIFREIKDSSEDLLSRKESLVALEAKVGNLERFKIIYEELEEILEKIDRLFVNLDVPVGFINFLETTSEKCQLGIEISPISVRKIEKEPWPSFSFQITSTGYFSNFLKFLEKLEASPYLIEIKNINVSRSKEAGYVKAIFSAKVFAK